MKMFLKIFFIPVGLIVIYLIAVLCVQFFYILSPSQGEMIDKEKSINTAILVVDVQNMLTFTDNPRKAAEYKVPRFLNNINLTINKLGRFEVIYIRNEFPRNSFLSFLLPVYPEECEPGTAVNSSIYIEGSKIFTKTKADAFTNPALQEYLNSKKTGTLYITGLAAEACVNSTIKGAIAKGYRVYVIREAVLSLYGGAPGLDRLDSYRSIGAEIVSVNDIK